MIVLRLSARFPLRSLVAFILGVLHAQAFRDDAAWPLELATLAALFALISQGASKAAAFAQGGAFGLGWFVTGIYWIFISVHTYGGVATPLAALATLLLSAYLALYPGAACALAVWGSGQERAKAVILMLLVPAWTLGEWARGTFLTGFPWLGTGYAHVGGPLRGYAPVLGVYGVTLAAAATAAVAVALADALPRARRSRLSRAGLALGVMLVGVPALGQALAAIDWSHAAGASLSVRLLQGGVPQDVKFDRQSLQRTVELYLQMVEARRADLIILPETALPEFLDELPGDILPRLADDAERMDAAIAFGVPIADSVTHYTNSVLAIDPRGGGWQRYDKVHLVPFGEFVPTGFHWFVRLMHIPLGDFASGSPEQRPMMLAGQSVAFNICYEDVFGEDLIGRAGDANILVNVSNIAWFGDSLALPQHLQLSRMRAIETARPMLRATNTGMTASVDPKGRVLAALPPFVAGSLDTRVQGVIGQTPYTESGNLSVLVIAAFAFVLIAAGARRPAKERG